MAKWQSDKVVCVYLSPMYEMEKPIDFWLYFCLSPTYEIVWYDATIVAAELDSKPRCKLACERVLADKYAQGRVGLNSDRTKSYVEDVF